MGVHRRDRDPKETKTLLPNKNTRFETRARAAPDGGGTTWCIRVRGTMTRCVRSRWFCFLIGLLVGVLATGGGAHKGVFIMGKPKGLPCVMNAKRCALIFPSWCPGDPRSPEERPRTDTVGRHIAPWGGTELREEKEIKKEIALLEAEAEAKAEKDAEADELDEAKALAAEEAAIAEQVHELEAEMAAAALPVEETTPDLVGDNFNPVLSKHDFSELVDLVTTLLHALHKYRIVYFQSGGTFLGIVRHQGMHVSRFPRTAAIIHSHTCAF